MEVKKSVKADLEWRKPMFIEIGLLAALAIVLLAFEFIGTRDKEEVFDFGPMAIIEEEQILQTEQQKETPPPPPQQNTTVLDIVSNELHVEDFSIDAEADEETVVEEVEYQIEDTQEEEIKEAEIFQVVEEMPSYPGGDEAPMSIRRNKNLLYLRGFLLYISIIVDLDLYYCPPKNSVCTE